MALLSNCTIVVQPAVVRLLWSEGKETSKITTDAGCLEQVQMFSVQGGSFAPRKRVFAFRGS